MLAITSRPPDLLDREREWRELDRAWTSGRPELALVLGRRRAGKSFLLARYARTRRGLYYQATRRTEAEQIDALSRAVGEHFHDAALTAGVPFPDWESLLRHLAGRAKRAPLLVVLDEFPYLVDSVPALPSILQAAWDRIRPGCVVLAHNSFNCAKRLEHYLDRLDSELDEMTPYGFFNPKEWGTDMVSRLVRKKILKKVKNFKYARFSDKFIQKKSVMPRGENRCSRA
jgi:AAA+ ATPase superfamily predicted ATPase